MGKYKIDCLVSDFDGSMTKENTTYLLFEALLEDMENDKKYELFDKYEKLTSEYHKGIKNILNEFVNPSNYPYREVLKNLSTQLELFENDLSCESVLLLTGTSKENIKSKSAKVEFMQNSKEVLSKMKDECIDLYVLSAGWSKDLIKSSVEEVIQEDKIYANNLIYGEDNRTTGELSGSIRSPESKLKKFRQIKEKNAGMTVSYVGDCVNDILCILDAEPYGFAIKPSDGLKLLVDSMEIPMEEISSWDELDWKLRV